MPRTNTTVTKLADTSSISIATTAADPTNGHAVSLDNAREGIVLQLANTADAPKAATVAGSPSLVVMIPAESSRLVPIHETARFAQPGNVLHLDLEAGFTGTVAALNVDPIAGRA